MSDMTGNDGGTRTCTGCTRTSDNKHFDCPPRMADGRLFTDYRARCDINYILPGVLGGSVTTEGKTLDSYKYRQFLIHNADAIMSQMRQQTYSSALCAPCVAMPDQPGTMLPEGIIQTCDSHSCTFDATQQQTVGGMGLGRQYGSSGPDVDAARERFMTNKRTEHATYSQRSANCCASESDVNEYVPVRGAAAGPIGRHAFPYGGTALHGGDPSVNSRRN